MKAESKSDFILKLIILLMICQFIFLIWVTYGLPNLEGGGYGWDVGEPISY